MKTAEKIIYIILFILACMVLANCKTAKTVTETFDSTHVETKEKAHVIKGGSATARFNLSERDYDIGPEIQGLTPTIINKDTTIIHRSDNGNVELEILIDSLGNVVAKCQAKDSIIYSKNQTIERLRSSSTDTTEEIPFTPWWAWMLIGAGPLIGGIGYAYLTKFIPFL